MRGFKSLKTLYNAILLPVSTTANTYAGVSWCERGWRPAGGPPPRLVLDGEALADTETPEGMDVDDGTIVDVYM